MPTPHRRTSPHARMLRAASPALALLCAAGSHAQTFVNDVAFLDRAARNEIVLGNIRGSIGVIDFDNDGWQDLFIADSNNLPNRLFRNVASATAPGGRTFQNATASSGLNDAQGTAAGNGAVLIFDADNDGDDDIFLGAPGPESASGLFYRNNGNGTFTNRTVEANLRIPNVFVDSASAVDFDHDGDLDIFIAAFLSFGRSYNLRVNNGDGTFTARNDLVPATAFTQHIYGHSWSDFDGDGWEDCLLALNVGGSPALLRNVENPAGGRMLVDATIASGFTSVGPAPMGIAVGDYDGDGDGDVVITDASVGTYFENVGGFFTRVTPFTTFFAWGTTWLDADNNGRLDNYQAGSWSTANTDHLRLNMGQGQWVNAQTALNTNSIASQYCARIDFDNDGREDIITVNPLNFVSIYHNQSRTSNNWAKVSLVGTGNVSRNAAGAIIRLTSGGVTQTREVHIGSSFAATEDQRAHFGLGSAASIDQIEVVWPRQGSIAQRTERFPGPFTVGTTITLSPLPPLCAGDSDGSGAVNFDDVTTTLTNFGATGIRFTPGDADGSGRVDFNDITTVLGNFGSVCP